MEKRKISLVIPVYNEEENILNTYNYILNILQLKCSEYDYEFIFTNNKSIDRSLEILENLSQKDKKVKVISFSKNFGYQKSILAGYYHSTGDAVIQVDCDLQDPPELIPELIEKWEAGYDVVYGVRSSRDESFLLNASRKLFYRIINWLSYDELPIDAGDFRLCSRRVIEALKDHRLNEPYIRGMVSEVGFNQTGVPYKRRKRLAGSSKFKLKELIIFAINGIFNYSNIPLRISFIIAIATSLITVIAIIGYTVGWYLGKGWPSGFATIILMILISLFINTLILGIFGEYLRRIFEQTKNRPMVIIEQKYNYD